MAFNENESRYGYGNVAGAIAAARNKNMLNLILLTLAFVLCLVAGLWQAGSPYRPQLGWLGLALYFLSLMLRH